MSLIQSIGQQFSKSAFAEKLHREFQSQPKISSLFVGATSSETVANVIAAMSYNENLHGSESNKLEYSTILSILSILSDSFRLLAVKQLQQNSLTQAEYLVIQILKVYVNHINTEQHSPEIDAIRKHVSQLTVQLDGLEKQRRTKTKNML